MHLPDIQPVSDWTLIKHIELAVEYFKAKIAEDDQLTGLFQDPLETLENHTGIALKFVSSSPSGCSVSGYYRPTPPTLHVHRSNSSRRDNFTALHELGHHLQQTDRSWAMDVLSELTDRERELLEEAVSDALASDILLPKDLVAEHLGSGLVTAKGIAALYGATVASRQACCIAAARHGVGDKALISLSDLDGKVVLSLSTAESLYRLPRGLVQPDLSRLIRKACDGQLTAVGTAQAGLVYSTTNRRYDIKFDVALDIEGRWAFSVARPEQEYGNQNWGKAVQHCPAPACEAIFEVDGATARCRCGDYKCPECGSCSCESSLPVCTECWTELSVADVAAGQSTHPYHDD